MRAEQLAQEGMSVRAALLDKVTQKFKYNKGSKELGLKCTVKVHVGINGMVLLVEIIKKKRQHIL